ncbi:hemerythrin domain-containing protein [Salinimicrobium flavum]|uniref:Hemerythrin domain-containing protein n=1 Tax=Salinimicrobium flavum TaxID=1737065 RepID=A0ABW5J1G7_9FLAO
MLLFLNGCGNKEDAATPSFSGISEAPEFLLEDHQAFLKQLEPFTSYKDSTGLIAKELYEVMEYHFKEEEDYVLPPLGILPALAKDRVPQESDKIMLQIEKFRKNETLMLAEHQMIGHFLIQLTRAAEREGHGELSGFEEALEKHAALEEEILFPAVLLIGDRLRPKLAEE